jgi:hypothetical protein
LEPCELPYIPPRLHSENKPEIPLFELGEPLYYRSLPDKVKNPFDGISLYDLSTNRGGSVDNPISTKEDALYNITPENGEGEKFPNKVVVTLVIKELSENETYEKAITHVGLDGNNNPVTLTCYIKLLHDKLPCNYSHCIFRIWFDGTMVTKQNYKNTFGKKGSNMSELRTLCKVEFEEMILREEVRMTWE